MKKLLLFLPLIVAIIHTQGQTSLYSENFNNVVSSFTLNTSDQGSAVSGVNKWVINNSYNGGSFIEPCLASNINIATTPAQPASITGYPNSRYLHIVNVAADAAGVSNANFVASDGGYLCYNNEANFAKMSNDISTVGYNNVSLSFYYLCAGSSASYGEVYYSTDGGSTWMLHQSNLYNKSSWTAANYTNAAWDNIATLRFGFRFVNNFTFSTSDPSFSVDDIAVTGTTIITNTITTHALMITDYCPGDSITTITFSATGSYASGNTFTAELSDALGSFASPTSLGSVASASLPIYTIIPLNTLAGSGYRIRVVSSLPAITGTDNGANITVGAFPSANFNFNANGLLVTFTDNSTNSDSWFWDFGDGHTSNLQNPTHTYTNIDTFNVCLTVTSTSGCSKTICRDVITSSLSIDDELSTPFTIYPNPTSDYIVLQFSESIYADAAITVMSVDGKMMLSQVLNNGNESVSLGGLSSGVYILQVTIGKQVHHTRIIIQ